MDRYELHQLETTRYIADGTLDKETLMNTSIFYVEESITILFQSIQKTRRKAIQSTSCLESTTRARKDKREHKRSSKSTKDGIP